MSRRPGSALAGVWVVVALLAACAAPALPRPNAAHDAARVLNQSAARALHQGNPDQALVLYVRALALAESVEDFELAGASLLNLALVHSRLGQSVAAQQRVDRILAAPQLYPSPLQSQAAARNALLALDRRDHTAALRWADAAQAACVAPCELAAAMLSLRAHVALEQGDLGAAAQLADKAAEQAAATGQDAEQANAWRLAGRAHSMAGRTDMAADMLARALAFDRRLGLPERVALDLLAAADNEGRRAQPMLSRAYLERALTVYLAAGHRAAADGVRSRIEALPK